MERLEELLIERLCQVDQPLEVQAVAMRSIIEVRGCAARDVATFFVVTPQVIIRALSLLHVPAERELPIAPAQEAPGDRQSHIQVA